MLAMLLCLTATASAEIDNVKEAMELSAYTFTEPTEIDVVIQITNVGDTDMPGPITLYYPDGTLVEEFGSPTLAAGASKSWSGKWTVTQSQLEAGKITFTVRYSIINDAGELTNKGKNFSMYITYTGAVASAEINRTITPTTAGKGQEVSITYDVVNTGNVEITDVSIKENSGISSKRGTIDSVAPGEKGSYTFTVTMGTKDLTSEATITYKAGGKTETATKEAATIKYGEVKLTASLKADKKGGNVGDTATLTLTLKNTGTVDYQNVTVTDALLGDVFTGTTVPAGKTVTLEKEITISQTADYQFTVTGQDTSGDSVETATERVSLTALDPSEAIVLTVEAVADRETVYTLPGTVKFQVLVTNNSSVDVENVTVSASGVQLYTFPSILAGETREFTRDVSVSMAGQYRFDAAVKNKLEETQTFESNIIQIAYSQPTTAPTEAPIITPPAPVYEDIPTDDGLPGYVDGIQSALNVLYWVFLVLAIASLALLIIGGVRRLQAAKESSKAQDHLERGTYRDYTQPAQKEKPLPKEEEPVTRPIGEDKEDPELPDAQEDDGSYVEDGELMAETLRKLYPRTGEERLKLEPTLTVEGEEPQEEDLDGEEPVYEEAPAEEEPVAEPAEEETQEEAPAVESEESQPGVSAAPRHRRSQRHRSSKE